MDKSALAGLLSKTLQNLDSSALPAGTRVIQGKVRDIVDRGNELLITTTDRISAFDRVLTVIPCKGEVLNTVSLFWFDNTADIVKNHVAERVSARTVRAVKCGVLPVEVVVRGYLAGSAWRDYQAGRSVSGITLPKGMGMNARFDAPLLTPSTKEEKGHHDMPISSAEIVSSGLMPEKTWKTVEETALALFRRGTEIAAKNGLILVDTKYEFGEREGKILLIDEIHTPDSSRYWYADTYQDLFTRGETQRELDKEFLRRWLMEKGFKGDGQPPAIPDDIRIEVAWRYITAWEKITGKTFTPGALGQAEESALVAKALAGA
jgi:phosphoribosylaminoimidazole-succinocarboxamide synthase